MKDILSGNPEDRVRFSRREALSKSSAMVLAGASLGSIGTAVAFRNFAEHFSTPYVDIDRYREGYPWIDGDREEELLSSLVSYEQDVNILYQDSNLIQGVLPENSHYLIFKGLPDPNISLNVFEVSVAGKRFVVPIVQSEDFAQGSLYIGDGTKSQMFMARRINLSQPDTSDLTDVSLSCHTVGGNPFAVELVRNSPLFYLRDENQDDASVTNDIPLSDTFRLGEGFKDEWLQDVSVELSGEDGGSSPHPLVERVARLRDVDSLAFYKVNAEGLTAEDAYSARSHEVFMHRRDNPSILPKGVRNCLEISTDNNMVSNPEDFLNKRCVSPLPDIIQRYLNHLTGQMITQRNLAGEIISIRENIRQGHIEKNDDYVNWFIRVKLKGSSVLIDDFV